MHYTWRNGFVLQFCTLLNYLPIICACSMVSRRCHADFSSFKTFVTSPPCGELLSIVLSMSLHSHIAETTWPDVTKCLCMMPVAVALSPSDGVTICYVLSVLWMNHIFTQGAVWSQWCVMCIAKRIEHNSWNYCINSNRMLLNDKDHQVCLYITGSAPGKSLPSMIALFIN